MAFINKYSGIIIVALVIAVVVLSTLLIAQNGGAPSPAAAPTSTTASASSTSPQTAANQTSTNPNVLSTPHHSTAGAGGTASATTGFAIHLVDPVPDETWIIAQQNLIGWDREAGVAGQIELLDATTYKLVGVILNQTGPHQTSYEWNTRDLLVSRNNPAKTTVVPGRYVVRIAFDGNNLSPVTSQPITIAAISE